MIKEVVAMEEQYPQSTAGNLIQYVLNIDSKFVRGRKGKNRSGGSDGR